MSVTKRTLRQALGRLARVAERPRAARVVGPLYDAAIALELRARAQLQRGEERCPPGRFDDVTVVIKTFERPAVLARLLRSLRREYPTLPVLVADDSRTPASLVSPHTRVLALPYDVGLSAGRNRALAEVTTPYFWLLDDDFVFSGTALEPSLAWLREHPRVDIVAGRVVDLPSLVPSPRRTRGPREQIDGLRRFDFVPHFFLGRTETARALGWDEELTLVEHSDFFERARERLVIVEDPRMRVLHARTLFDLEYMAKRRDVARYVALRRAKAALRAAERVRARPSDPSDPSS